MIAGERWGFTLDGLLEVAEVHAQTARLGVRAFPALNDGCAAGPITPPGFDHPEVFQRIPEPTQEAQTPITAALEGLEVVFGDPDESEAVILLTDGDETCADELGSLLHVETLRMRGIRTFAVGISRQVNADLLSAIAHAGGTARPQSPAHYMVNDGESLAVALEEIFDELATCRCMEGEQRCEGDMLQICDELGFGFELESLCDSGCDPQTQECRPCRPNSDSFECFGDRQMFCSEDGEGFVLGERCEHSCHPEWGCNPVCRPGNTRCSEGDKEICNEAGDGWSLTERCEEGCEEGIGSCLEDLNTPCLRGADFRCGPEGLEICVDGHSFELWEPCEICNELTAQCVNDEEGALRLVGDVPEEGRLEIFHSGHWGTICDDDFRARIGQVACRQMGYSGFLNESRGWAGEGEIWMDELRCDGNELYFNECRFDGWGQNNCDHEEDLGIECRVPQIGNWFCSGDQSITRLPDSIRKVQCSRGCNPETGHCVGTSNINCIYGAGVCLGSDLVERCYDHTIGYQTMECAHGCMPGLGMCAPELEYSLRIAGGGTEGRLEIWHDGSWGSVCDDGFDYEELAIACMQMGMHPVGISEGYLDDGEIWLDDIQCIGNESRLQECEHRPLGDHDCTHEEDVWIACEILMDAPVCIGNGLATRYTDGHIMTIPDPLVCE